MDNKTDGDKSVVDEGSQLVRNRSFKTKQLVRSQAIRESASPPRTISPSVREPSPSPTGGSVTPLCPTPPDGPTIEKENESSHDGDLGYNDRRKPVSIQITAGGCESEFWCRGRMRRGASDARLLSNNPRVACVCGACAACPQCRGKKRRYKCPTKQDSGIVCSDDCQDGSDTEQNGDTGKKSNSLDVDEYCKCPDRKDKEKPKSISLTRTDSEDKLEPTGPELVSFIKDTLNKNSKDRVTLLRIEKELYSFVNDTGRCIVKFPVMTSYGRMLVHRCAALFQLSHHIDHNNKNCVIVSKSGTSGGRIPCTGFKSWCITNFPPSPQRLHNDATNAKSILKRAALSLDEPAGGALSASRSKSLEQRERDYETVRRRIFSSDESQWPWLNSGPIKLLAPDHRNKLLKVQSLEGPSASTTDSSEGVRGRAAAVAKSHSFGGYVEHGQRALSKQGDLASSSWRLSPSSSGYKTLSLRSTDSVTPSPTGGGTPEPGAGGAGGAGGVCAGGAGGACAGGAGGAVVWAVTDLSAVPPGALVIHPQTGRPITNPDGSVYQFDPANPPAIYQNNNTQSNKVDENNEKRRGRLEKQDSFIDNDVECQHTEECRNKCHCECARHEQQKPQEKEQPKPSTPIKNRLEPPENEPTNHKPAAETPTNQNAVVEVQQPITERVDPPPTNRRQHDNQIQIKNNEIANPRDLKAVDYNMMYGLQYAPAYAGEERTTPLPSQYIHEANMHNPEIQQARDAVYNQHHVRPLALTNIMCAPLYQPGFNYTQLPPDQAMYQPVLNQQLEDQQKAMNAQQNTQENAFRIDPSYPYPPIEYAACACTDNTQQQRNTGYNIPYNQVEVQPVQSGVVPASYPLQNVLLPHHVPQYPVQYQEAVQWPPLPAAPPALYDVCPVVYPPQYAHYNLLYPQSLQMVQPTYPTYPVYTLDKQDRPRKRTSLPPSSRNTPLTTPEEKQEEKRHSDINIRHENIRHENIRHENIRHENIRHEHIRQHSEVLRHHDINEKITQIKEQMGQLNVRGRERNGEWRNHGNGILGSYPVGVNGRFGGNQSGEDTQLSTAARAIVNSIRSMQARNTYQDKRYSSFGGPRRPPPHATPAPDRKHDGRAYGSYRTPYLFRQMSPNTWCRRSPAPVHPAINHPRRPHPDNRNIRR